jgi:hypothetical protein
MFRVIDLGERQSNARQQRLHFDTRSAHMISGKSR